MAESKEELKSLLIKVKEESEKASLKLNIQKMKIMASGPIISWVQLLSHVRHFATPWTAGRQASLSITNSRGLLKLMSIESMMNKRVLKMAREIAGGPKELTLELSL